jgi:ribosomal protein L11
MTRHKISIQAQAATVTASTLTELLRQTGTKIMQFSEGLDINHRTAQRRMKEPETLTIKELLALSALLRVPEQQLLDLIRDEYHSRPAQPAAEPGGEVEILPSAKKATPKRKPKLSK